MQDRRDFLKTTVAAASLLAINSVPRAFAAGNPMYTNIIYTKDNPGRWVGKAAIHAPQVTVTGSKVNVVTNHPMSNEHYIVRHTLVLEDGTYIGSTTFTPADKPESSYELPAGYKGKFYATSFCNLHDFWLTESMV
ncbi:MAG: desulfoferrodoxin family protein [Desulfocapsaceae bacterium]|nr:desulfoferrodoxin family protein [Desulfocapsaceae bacterium]